MQRRSKFDYFFFRFTEGNPRVLACITAWIPPRVSAGPPAHRSTLYPEIVSLDEREEPVTRIGLCADCQFVRRMESDRGSVFYMCQRSATDPSFPKYPRLPVLQCAGFESATSASPSK